MANVDGYIQSPSQTGFEKPWSEVWRNIIQFGCQQRMCLQSEHIIIFRINLRYRRSSFIVRYGQYYKNFRHYDILPIRPVFNEATLQGRPGRFHAVKLRRQSEGAVQKLDPRSWRLFTMRLLLTPQLFLRWAPNLDFHISSKHNICTVIPNISRGLVILYHIHAYGFPFCK